MKPAFTNLNVAVCVHSMDDHGLNNQLKEKILRSLSNFSVIFFEHTNKDADLKNLWNIAHQKRQYEIHYLKKEFDVCVSICVNEHTKDFLSSDILLYLLVNLTMISKVEENVLYFSTGGFKNSDSSTFIDPWVFYADSLTFDIASNFAVVQELLPQNKKSSTMPEDFYYYLKSLKVRTECINYENCGLFKRSA